MRQKANRRTPTTIRKQVSVMVYLCVLFALFAVAVPLSAFLVRENGISRTQTMHSFANQMGASLDSTVRSMDRLLVSYAGNQPIRTLLNQKNVREQDRYARTVTFRDFLLQLSRSSEDIFDIGFYLDTGEKFMANNWYVIDTEVSRRAAEALREEENPRQLVLVMPEYRYHEAGTSRKLICLMRLLYNDYDTGPVGYAALYCKQRILNTSLHGLQEDPAFSQGEMGMLILDGDYLIFDSKAETDDSVASVEYDRQAGTLTVDGHACQFEAVYSDYTKLTTIVYLPQFIMLREEMGMLGAAVLLLFLVSVAMLFSGSRMATRIVRPIEELARTMEKTDVLHTQTDPVPTSRNMTQETESLYTSYRLMLAETRTLYRQDLEYRENLTALENRTLSMQVNPHYLYNVLGMIGARCYAYGQEDIVEVCEDLAETMRYNIKAPTLVTLEQELAFCRKYLKIIRALYGREIEFITQIDPDCADAVMPKVTLQPLLENAVMHGLLRVERPGRIRIRAARREDSVQIRVEDNGAGMTPEQVQALNESLQRPVSQFLLHDPNHIGVSSVHYRITQQFGEAFGLSVEGGETGVSVSIRLPLP